jgi:hypothetical protein
MSFPAAGHQYWRRLQKRHADPIGPAEITCQMRTRPDDPTGYGDGLVVEASKAKNEPLDSTLALAPSLPVKSVLTVRGSIAQGEAPQDSSCVTLWPRDQMVPTQLAPRAGYSVAAIRLLVSKFSSTGVHLR